MPVAMITRYVPAPTEADSRQGPRTSEPDSRRSSNQCAFRPGTRSEASHRPRKKKKGRGIERECAGRIGNLGRQLLSRKRRPVRGVDSRQNLHGNNGHLPEPQNTSSSTYTVTNTAKNKEQVCSYTSAKRHRQTGRMFRQSGYSSTKGPEAHFRHRFHSTRKDRGRELSA
jgi:hypothetical protein